MKFFVSTFFFTDKSSQKVVFCKDQCSCPSMDIVRWEKYFKRTDKYKTYAGFFQISFTYLSTAFDFLGNYLKKIVLNKNTKNF